MLLQLSTWQEIDDYLQTSTAILIPIGSTEQHGPNGLLGTDAICPQAIAYNVSEIMPILVAPTLSIGMAQHHLAFAGTISLRPSTFLAYLVDVIESLAGHGFEHVYFLNGHGGNIATLTAAFSEVYAKRSFGQGSAADSKLECRLRNWWEGPRVQQLSKELFPGVEGMHATPSEVSLTYHVYPHAIKNVSMSPTVAPKGEFYDAADYRRRFPDGRIGSNPALANPTAGERLLQAGVEDTLEDIRRFLDQER